MHRGGNGLPIVQDVSGTLQNLAYAMLEASSIRLNDAKASLTNVAVATTI